MYLPYYTSSIDLNILTCIEKLQTFGTPLKELPFQKILSFETSTKGQPFLAQLKEIADEAKTTPVGLR